MDKESDLAINSEEKSTYTLASTTVHIGHCTMTTNPPCAAETLNAWLGG